MTLVDTHPRPTTVFTVRGTDPVALEVRGPLDAEAVVSFHAVADWLIGARSVTLDLTSCPTVDAVGDRAVDEAVRRIVEAGGKVTLRS